MILTGAPVGGAGVAPVVPALAVAPVEPDFIGMATTGVPGDPVVAAVPTRAGVPVEGADALLRVLPVVLPGMDPVPVGTTVVFPI